MKSAAPSLIETNALRLTAALLVAFAPAFFVYYGIDTMRAPIFAIDFSPYYVAGQLLAEGRAAELILLPTDGLMTSSSPPFVANFQRYFFPDSKSGAGWIYLPGYAWLFRPLAGLEFPVAVRLWLLSNALLSAGAVALLAWAQPWPGDQRYRRWRLAWIVFFGLTFQPVLDNMWHGNTSAVILFVFCLSYLLLRSGRNGLAGLALGLIEMLKFYPTLIVFYYVWLRNLAYVAGVLAGAAAMVGLSWLTVGAENLLRYAGLLLTELEAGGVAAFNNQSLTGFLIHALTPGDVNGWEDMTVPLAVAVLRYAAILALVDAADHGASHLVSLLCLAAAAGDHRLRLSVAAPDGPVASGGVCCRLWADRGAGNFRGVRLCAYGDSGRLAAARAAVHQFLRCAAALWADAATARQAARLCHHSERWRTTLTSI